MKKAYYVLSAIFSFIIPLIFAIGAYTGNVYGWFEDELIGIFFCFFFGFPIIGFLAGAFLGIEKKWLWISEAIATVLCALCITFKADVNGVIFVVFVFPWFVGFGVQLLIRAIVNGKKRISNTYGPEG